MAFRGTEGLLQLIEQLLQYHRGQKAFFDHGSIYEYFYNAFHLLWTGGFEKGAREVLGSAGDDYELWVSSCLPFQLSSFPDNWSVPRRSSRVCYIFLHCQTQPLPSEPHQTDHIWPAENFRLRPRRLARCHVSLLIQNHQRTGSRAPHPSEDWSVGSVSPRHGSLVSDRNVAAFELSGVCRGGWGQLQQSDNVVQCHGSLVLL